MTSRTYTEPGVINPEPSGSLNSALRRLSTEAKELYLGGEVPVLDAVPPPLQFYREWVAPNKPVVLRGAVQHWPALTRWTIPYLREKVGGKRVTVAVTPNGLADAPHEGHFVMPEERTMTLANFLDIMQAPHTQPGVFYIQKQNSNLTEEFEELVEDAGAEVEWFSEALGRSPDAANFWMGDQRAVTSLHKDHYENIYCVVSGHKDFVLLPPTDAPWLPYRKYPAASYRETSPGRFTLQQEPSLGPVPWISVDPLAPDTDQFPQYRQASPVQCRLHAGDALYLPSLWFHHVRQSHACIALNFWYDMDYDIKFNYFQFIQNLTWKEELV